MEMLHPEGNIDTQWVDNVSALIRELTTQRTQEAAAARTRAAQAAARLRTSVDNALVHQATRKALLADTTAPLAVLAQAYKGVNPAATYLSAERSADALVSALQAVGEAEASGVGACALERACVAAGARACAQLAVDLPALNEMLLELHNTWSAETGGRRLTRQAAVVTSRHNKHGTSGVGPWGGGAGGGAGGARSAWGAGVWRRVRLKLEGRDTEPARRAMPHEQVDYIISEATSAENLCLMYEGWMAWV
ncbi:hypothetical protein ABMA28_004281 [Loxostege sticticalis]|uniref:FATC domain-containing protein n=1 Tax=Loxostege sticticalis TaxID=481309 RepID=A0ABD0ST08_LOXSC